MFNLIRFNIVQYSLYFAPVFMQRNILKGFYTARPFIKYTR